MLSTIPLFLLLLLLLLLQQAAQGVWAAAACPWRPLQTHQHVSCLCTAFALPLHCMLAANSTANIQANCASFNSPECLAMKESTGLKMLAGAA
jgi:hypothetical protein